VLLLTAGAARAEEGILVVHVTYLDKKPLPRVRIGTAGDGSIEVTDVGGRARIRLAPGMKAGQEVGLQIVSGENDKDSWVFISPWDQRVRVPPFDGGQAIPVALAKKADKDALLGSSEGRKAIEQSILSELSKLQQASSEITEEQRRTVLQAQAAAYGLKPEEVDAAIRAASQKSPDLYEQGLAALYKKNYPVASERLKEALAAGEKELAQAQEKVGDRAFFLGESLYEQGQYPESVTAFKRATELRGELGDQSSAREIEKSLAWLLTAPEVELSAQQRQIREYLKAMQENEQNHLLTPPAPSAPNSQLPRRLLRQYAVNLKMTDIL
jgi:tetratricopeptide (TPR) repeat protein